MSRDWTPEQMLLVEKNGTPIIEFMKGLSWVINGEKIPMYSKEDIAICEQFTYLGKLYERFASLYKLVCKFQGGEEVLKELETELKEYIEEGKKPENPFIVSWYHGKLDPCFYYHERNDELLHEKVLERVRQRVLEGKKPSLDEKIAGSTSVLEKIEVEREETRGLRDLHMER